MLEVEPGPELEKSSIAVLTARTLALMLACALSTKRQFLAQVTNPQAFVNAS